MSNRAASPINSVEEHKTLTFWGCDWEVISTIYVEPYAAEFYLPNGRLDWERLTGEKRPVSRSDQR